MTLIEIKKALYKEKPTAHLEHIRKIGPNVSLVYMAKLSEVYSSQDLIFDVPSSELGDGLYGKEMPAQLLIRYISYAETEKA